MSLHGQLCSLWLALASLILWVNATNIKVSKVPCGKWNCDGLEIGGQSGSGPRRFLMSCNVRMPDPKDKKKTIVVSSEQNCLTGNPHGSSFYTSNNKNKPKYYEDLRDKICKKIDQSTGKAGLKERPVDKYKPADYLYYEVVVGRGRETDARKTGREFTKAELDNLRRTGNIETRKWGKVVYKQGAKKGPHGGYQRVRYQLQDQYKPKRIIIDDYGITWTELNKNECL